MKLYLAGGYTGNLKPFFDQVMKIHLSGAYSRLFVYEEAMRLFLAGSNDGNKWKGEMDEVIKTMRPNLLESYFYIKDHPTWYLDRRDLFSDFILDSGAFSFFGGQHQIDWKKYTSEYCEFINTNEIDFFFEMDIEKITSMETTEYLRKMIQDKTMKDPIPVWRPMRGIDYWYQMIDEFKYIAISASGKYDSAWTRKKGAEEVLNKMVNLAREKNVKVHGLGYTKQEFFKRIKFDSVDSTAWLYGNRGGFIYEFKKDKLIKHKVENSRLKGRLAAIHNFNEWVKYSKYLETNV